MRRALALSLLLGCSDPATEPSAPTLNVEGVRVIVAGREVVVHCALTCPASEGELTRLSGECLADPSSGPHHVAIGGTVLTLGCCEEAQLAYDRGCGHETLAGCAAAWATRCEGMEPPPLRIDDGDRGVAPTRGVSP